MAVVSLKRLCTSIGHKSVQQTILAQKTCYAEMVILSL